MPMWAEVGSPVTLPSTIQMAKGHHSELKTEPMFLESRLLTLCGLGKPQVEYL